MSCIYFWGVHQPGLRLYETFARWIFLNSAVPLTVSECIYYSAVLCRDSGRAVCGQRSGLPLVQLGRETVGRPDELAALHHVLVLRPDGGRVPGRPHHGRRSAGTGQVDVGVGLLY